MDQNREARFAASLRQARAGQRVAEGSVKQLEAENGRLAEENRELRSGPLAPLQVLEPRTYEPASPYSFFLDMARAEYRGDEEARARLERHKSETSGDTARRIEARARAAARAYEERFYSTPADRQRLDAFVAAGGRMFEPRAISRVDGQGGFFVPPAWLVDQYVPPARANTAFSALWTTLPLPRGCDSINVPIMSTGTATGAQQDATPPPSHDVADTFVNALVRTIAGSVDASAQWLDQGTGAVGGGVDEIIFNDLTADAGLQLDGQALLGGDLAGQALSPSGLRGVWPGGQISTALAVQMINTNNNATQTWSNPGGSSTTLNADLARLLSGLTRARAQHPTHLVSHPWIWDFICSSVDDQHRPIVNIHGPANSPGGPETGPGQDGVLGHVHGLPFVGDPNVPTTFGGTIAPYLGMMSGAQYAGQPGTGATAIYTPILACRPADMYAWLSEPDVRLIREALAGSNQVRFQFRRYAALIPNRYQALGAGTLPNSSGWTAGAATAYGTLTQQTSNGLLQVVAQGF